MPLSRRRGAWRRSCEVGVRHRLDSRSTWRLARRSGANPDDARHLGAAVMRRQSMDGHRLPATREPVRVEHMQQPRIDLQRDAVAQAQPRVPRRARDQLEAVGAAQVQQMRTLRAARSASPRRRNGGPREPTLPSATPQVLGADAELDALAGRERAAASIGTSTTQPACTSTRAPAAEQACAVAGTRLIVGEPRKAATNRLAGCSYSASGEPTCSMRPSCITTMRSPSVIASTWSCVT